MGNENEYQVYLDKVRGFLEGKGNRLLTEKEEEIVVAHLKVVAATYCSKHSALPQVAKPYTKVLYDGLGITQVLGIETAKKVCELHEEFADPTPEAYDQRVAEVLAVQNYLKGGGLDV